MKSCIMNLLDFVTVIIGLVSVDYVVPLPVFLGRKWGYSGHSGRGVTSYVHAHLLAHFIWSCLHQRIAHSFFVAPVDD